MWTFSWTGGLIHNLVSIRPNYNLDNLQNLKIIWIILACEP